MYQQWLLNIIVQRICFKPVLPLRVCSCLNYCDLPNGNNAAILYVTNDDSDSAITIRPKVLEAFTDRKHFLTGRPSAKSKQWTKGKTGSAEEFQTNSSFSSPSSSLDASLFQGCFCWCCCRPRLFILIKKPHLVPNQCKLWRWTMLSSVEYTVLPKEKFLKVAPTEFVAEDLPNPEQIVGLRKSETQRPDDSVQIHRQSPVGRIGEGDHVIAYHTQGNLCLCCKWWQAR